MPPIDTLALNAKNNRHISIRPAYARLLDETESVARYPKTIGYMFVIATRQVRLNGRIAA